MLIDLHVHSSLSACSQLDLSVILKYARSFGLDGVCITDHDTMEARQQVREGVQDDGLVVIIGMEYTTPQGDFLCYGPVEGISAGLDAPKLFEAVRERGGIVTGAHPYRGWRLSDDALFVPGGCEIVETVNGRNTLAENMRAASLAEKRGLASVAGSDAHALEELAACPTQFDVKISCREDLVAALKAGACRPGLTCFAEAMSKVS